MSTISRLYPSSGLAALVLVECSSQPAQPLKKGEKAVDMASVVRQKMSASMKNRDVWTQDLAKTFESQKLTPTVEDICSVLTAARQESSFQADPTVPDLNKITWEEIDHRIERMHVLLFAVRTALETNSPTGKSCSERLDTVKTRKQFSAIFGDFINVMSIGQALLESFNPAHTDGPAQVSIAFAEQHTGGYPWKMAGTVRQEVFSRRGGLWFGTYHLLNYPASYNAPIFRFADFNVGWYASHSAAFQSAVSKASGVKLAMDGDLILYGNSEPGKTELAVRKPAEKLGVGESEIRQQLQRDDSLAFEKTTLYEKVYKLTETKTGKALPREMLSDIQLEGPKITRNLTIAWFAKHVDDRRAKCTSQSSL